MLRILLDNWQRERSGAARIAMRVQINTYLQQQKLEVVEEEINSCSTIKELKIIQGAGVRGIVYDMMYKRRLSLMGFIASAPGSLSNLGEDAQVEQV